MATYCVHESKYNKNYVRCKRNGSIRKVGCHADCPFYERKPTFWERLERWFAKERDF